MKKKNGFTLVELIVSISLTMIVVIILFEIIVILKDLFQSSSIKTELLNKKSIIVEKIYSDTNDGLVIKIEQCGDYCVDFTTNEGSTKRLIIDKENLVIGYGDYNIKLSEGYSIGNITITNDVTTYISNENNNGIFKIKIPIYSTVTNDDDLGIDIVFTYNSANISVSAIDIQDENNNKCTSADICKSNTYEIGSEISFGNYNFHIIQNEENSITLLLDAGELSSRSHVDAITNTYKWSTSYINSYLNETFYNSLIDAGVDVTSFLTAKIGVCDDETNNGGNPGILETDNETCNTSYVYSNIRLMSISEYDSIKAYLNENNIDSNFLYSSSTSGYVLINGNGSSNEIVKVSSDGSTVLSTYSEIVGVRPIIIINKK